MQSAINRGLFYNGEWNTPLSSSTYETVNPATGESLGDIANAQIEDVDQALHSADAAFTLWSELSPIERASYLRIAADTLLKHKEDIARLDDYLAIYLTRYIHSFSLYIIDSDTKR